MRISALGQEASLGRSFIKHRAPDPAGSAAWVRRDIWAPLGPLIHYLAEAANTFHLSLFTCCRESYKTPFNIYY